MGSARDLFQLVSALLEFHFEPHFKSDQFVYLVAHKLVHKRTTSEHCKMAMEEAPPTPEELLEFLIDSARYGDTDDVRTALKEGVAVDGTDGSGRTGAALCALLLLPRAVETAGEWRLVWQPAPSPHTRPTNTPTALHMAAANGHADIVAILLEGGAVSRGHIKGRRRWAAERSSFGTAALRSRRSSLPLIHRRARQHAPRPPGAEPAKRRGQHAAALGVPQRQGGRCEAADGEGGVRHDPQHVSRGGGGGRQQ